MVLNPIKNIRLQVYKQKNKNRDGNMNFNRAEHEVIGLKAIIETIDSMINFEIFELKGYSPDTEVYFYSTTHQKYFYIILVDFLSKMDEKLSGKRKTCCDLLIDICENPSFDQKNSISFLKTPVSSLIKWLDEEVEIESWFPSIDKDIVLKLKRFDFITICSNISKHNFARLTNTSEKLIQIFKKNNICIDLQKALIIIDEFYERFFHDILIYHGSNLVEMLNNIRWGIHKYLLPEFNKSFKRIDSICYEYAYPKDVNLDFSKVCYWELMNYVRSKPIVKKFESTKYLKLKY